MIRRKHRDHHAGRTWWAPVEDFRLWRERRRQERAEAAQARVRDASRRAEAVPGAPAGILRVSRAVALGLASAIVVAASVAAFAESYRALWLWALHHGLAGFWADVFALQIDSFIAVGELALLVALVDQWKARSRVFPWLVTLGGLAVSVAANVGHVASADLATRATAAVPPVAAASALAVGLGILKRVITARRATTLDAPEVGGGPILPEIPTDAEVAAMIALRATMWAGNALSGRQLETRFGLTRQQATRVRQLVGAEANGHHPEDSTADAIS